MGMRGVSATILNSRNTRKPLKKIQTPAPVPRSSAPVGSDRLILNLQQNATESDQQSANVGASAHARAFLKSPETVWGQHALGCPAEQSSAIFGKDNVWEGEDLSSDARPDSRGAAVPTWTV